MSSMATSWQIYRTRFLIRARQLDAPLAFTDPLGREHRGQKGDYLVESADGLQRIAPREIFEDIYVPMGPASEAWPQPADPPLNRNPAALEHSRSSARLSCERSDSVPTRTRRDPLHTSLSVTPDLAARWTGKSA